MMKRTERIRPTALLALSAGLALAIANTFSATEENDCITLSPDATELDVKAAGLKMLAQRTTDRVRVSGQSSVSDGELSEKIVRQADGTTKLALETQRTDNGTIVCLINTDRASSQIDR